jgi:hypothetical protein
VWGWVDIGIEDDTATMFNELQIGEVIPRLPPNMDIFKNTFSTRIIGKLLGITRPNRKYRVIMNFYSFSRLIKIILNCRSNDFQTKFNKDLKETFTDIIPRRFWLNVLVTEDVANYLRANEIGEVIVKDGGGKFFDIKELTSSHEQICWDAEAEDDTKEDTKMEDCTLDMMQNLKLEEVSTSFRLIFDNKTFLKLINYGCKLKGNTSNEVNVYELMSSKNDDFTNIFSKLQI